MYILVLELPLADRRSFSKETQVFCEGSFSRDSPHWKRRQIL
jgi:hypothetical protein